MRRIFTLTLFLITLGFAAEAQWLLYDASVLPSETGGAELDLTSLSQDEPGPNFVEAIMDDPDIAGNSLLQYVQPDEMNIAMDGNATKMYRSYLGGYTGTQMTLVARLKGVPNWEELGLDGVFHIQYRMSTSESRDELRVNYGGELKLQESAEVETGMDFTQWNTFRIAVDGATSTVYVNESNVPALTGTSDRGTGDYYIKIADGSGDKVGGYVDWFAVDTTGAYSPAEKPLDERFTGAPEAFDPTDYKIAFITRTANEDFTVLDEQPMIDHLRERGFTVDVSYPTGVQVPEEQDFEFSFEALEEYDLVIIGRATSSGDFRNGAEENWAALETPVIIFSGYLMRNSRLRLINSGSLQRETSDGTTVDPARVTNISIADTPLFTGLDEDEDGEIGYQTWFYDYLAYGADSFEMNHNATLHGSLVSTDTTGNGSVYVASWEAGVEGYPGAGITQMGRRLYMQIGADDNSTPKLENYFPLTEETVLMYHNALKWMLGAEPDGQLIEPVAPSDVSGKLAFISSVVNADGYLEEAGLIAELRKRGYQVDVTYPGNEDFSFEAMNDYDVVIIGRGVSSGDFRDQDAVDGWASVESPVILFSAYLMRNSRLKIANTGTAGRERSEINGDTIPRDRITNATIVDDPLFTGVDMDMDGSIGYLTWFYDFLGVSADTFEATHNATLLATLDDADGGRGDGTVAMALWEAGNETYAGSGVTPMGDRLFMLMGSDDNSTPKLINFTAFTDESLIVLFNAIDWLSGRDPSGELPEAGPVAYWNFDEGTGATVNNVLGGPAGEIMNGNGMTWESCGVNNSINFAGATKDDAIIMIPDDPIMNFDSTDSWSISMLVKVDPFSNLGEMTLITKGDNGMALPEGMGKWYAIATKDMQLRLAVDDNVTKTQLDVDITQDMFAPDQWNHIVGVRDLDEDSLKMYLNGVLVGSIADDTDGDISTNDIPTVVGNYHSSFRRANGNIDELIVFDRALSADDVAELFANTEITNDCEVIEPIEDLSNDASLATLEVNPGSLDPAFDPEVTTYSVVLPAGSTSVEVTATANDPNATVEGTGTISDVPTTAVITVTAEDSTTRDYTLNISVEGVGPGRTIVEPGFGTLELAVTEANNGDTLVLQNGELYTPIDASYTITKKLVIIAEEVAALPGLENQPVISNDFGIDPLFNLAQGADLHLIGIDVDGGLAANIFNGQGSSGESRTFSIYVNRCRLHNTTDDIFNDARDGNTDNTQLTSCIFRNSFIYDSGLGHGIYVKNYVGSNSDYIFENLTFWNLGQQFNWIRHYTQDDEQTFVFDHMTGYNLSTAVEENKELFGNSDNEAVEAVLTIDMKNTILHTQQTREEAPSLWFDNTSGRHDISIRNMVLFDVGEVTDRGGETQKENIDTETDPMFVDPDNGDFTVMNSALYEAATDGDIIGATYWHPDFVDDFDDLVTSARDILRARYGLSAFPNPFQNEVTVRFSLENAARVQLNLYDLNGKLINEVMDEFRPAGENMVNINTSTLNPGMYFYQLRNDGSIVASKMIKTE